MTRRTPTWLHFDLVFGVLLPIVCLVFDPFVFQTGTTLGLDAGPRGGRALVPYARTAYVFCGIEMGALLWWLLIPPSSARWRSALGGVLALGALASVMVGFLLLPLSVFGLLAIIGILGFTPFLTFVTFARNAMRAGGSAEPEWFRWECAGACAVVALTAAAHAPTLYANHVVHRLVTTPSMTADDATNRLRWIQFAFDTDEIAAAYAEAYPNANDHRLEEVYRRLTGASLTERAAEIRHVGFFGD